MQLGSYRILRPLAEDSLGPIYLAQDGGRQVVVRHLRSALLADPRVVDRLRSLALSLGTPVASGLVKVLALSQQGDGSALWVTPLMPGTNLAELLMQRSRLNDISDRLSDRARVKPLPGALSIACRVAGTLALAHSRGTHHLGLRPELVLVDIAYGSKAEIKVYLLETGLTLALIADLPVAAASPPEELLKSLAPEQRASGVVAAGSAASDVYALGALLLQLLTGHDLRGPEWPVTPAQLEDSGVPKGVAALLFEMLAREPRARPGMAQVEAALRSASESEEQSAIQPQLLAYQGTLAGSEQVALAPPNPDAADPQPLPEPVLTGVLMGNFRLIRKLGAGGMGVVYEAEHQQIGHRAAVKVLHRDFADNPDYAKRFLNEARAVNIIRHPGLVEIFEYGQRPDGTLYIVMEFLDGKTLYQLTGEAAPRLPIEKVAELGVQLARALATAHEKGIVHRDLKPENIMLISDPVRADAQRVKILDFGIAKLARRGSADGAAGHGGRTDVGAVMGTPLYMAPEQFGKAESAEGSADVFALGVILYELLAGRRPYETDSLSVLSRPIEPLQKLNPAIPAGMAALIMEMLALSAGQRPSMLQVAERLVPWSQVRVHRTSPLRYVLLGGAAAVLALAVAYALLLPRRAITTAQAQKLALAAIRTSLRAQDGEERLRAVQALGMSRDPAQIELLVPLLADPAVAGPAARALGSLGAVSAQPALVALLASAPNNQVRLDAATALAQLAHPTGTATLHALLGEADGVTQVESALRLLDQGDLAGAQLLHRLARGESAQPSRVLPVLAALTRAGDEAARQQLARLAAGPGPLAADPLLLYSLARTGDATAQSRLGAQVARPGAEQVVAARFLAALGQDDGHELLLQISGDARQPDAVRELAIEGLADRGRFDATAPLAGVLKGAESKRLRLTAAGAILHLAAGEPSRRAEQSLAWSRMALGSDSTAIRELAVGLLGDVESEATIPPLRQALRDREREVRRCAARALGKKHVRAALEALSDSLQDADGEVRSAGMRAIGQVVAALHRRGDRDADRLVQQQLRQLTHSGDELDRVVASGILLQTGDTAQAGTLRAGLQSGSPLIRRLAIELGEQDLRLLRAGLSDPDRLVRLAAARRLLGSDAAAATPVLAQLATQGDQAGLAAYAALRKLGEPVAEPPEPSRHLVSGPLRERTAILEGVPELPPALALRLLLTASVDESPLVRQCAGKAAFELAARTGRPEFRRLLAGLRGDANAAVRMNAEALLGQLPDEPRQAGSPPVSRAPDPPAAPLAPSPVAAPAPASELAAAPEPREGPGAAPAAPAATADKSGKEAEAQRLLAEIRAALQGKQYSRAQDLLNRARRLVRHSGSRSTLPSELLFLQASLYELRGQWREAMAAYTQYEQLPPAQRVAASSQAVASTVARLMTRMGKIQIFTLAAGQCRKTEEYFLPAGEHIISLGGGQTRTVQVDAGLTTPVRQCP